MRMFGITSLVLVAALFLFSGCDGGSNSSQAAFYHNNRAHQQWVKNPGKKPDFRNPATGGKMFY